MATSLPHLLTLSSLLLLLLLLHSTSAATSAPAPSPSGPTNLTDILSSNGAYSTFLRLLASTQAADQITNQLKSSTEGMTIFAPTDNAFSTLKAGTLNSLSAQQQVQLVLYHVLPKFYTWDTFETVSNPVNTQASGRTGNWGLNITTFGVQQVNISTGVVETQINNALKQKFPLAVYQLEKVLLPDELFGEKAKAPASSPAADDAVSSSPAKTNSTAATTASPSSAKDSSAAAGNGVVLGFVAGIGAVCMGLVF